MRRQLCTFTVVLLMICAAATAAWAQWSSDPAANLAIADREDEQAVEKIAVTSDGGAYVGWYDHASGNYDVYLQKLDPLGFEVWEHNGILVSGNPQDTWVTDWHLIADSADHAVLALTDIRDEGDHSLNAYRVGPKGEMVWGEDGIVLAVPNDDQFPGGVRIVQASDGDLVFVWTEWTPYGGGKLMMQRISPEGVVRFGEGGIALSNGKGGAPAFPDLAPSDDGGVIVCWLTDNRFDSTKKYLVAQKFAADGSTVWNKPVSVFDEYSIPRAYKPGILADGEGGAFLVWYFAPWLIYNSAIQHLDADGVEIFPHNGVTFSTNLDIDHLAPTMTFDALSGEVYVFVREYDSWSGRYGIYGQRFSPQGDRLWGDTGAALVPLGTVDVSPPLAVSSMGGSLVFWMDRPTMSWDNVRVLGMRVESDGSIGWGGEPISVSTTKSEKARLVLGADPFGGGMLVWEDRRNNELTGKDIYGQNVNADGTLGN